jgi:hypothetical protein
MNINDFRIAEDLQNRIQKLMEERTMIENKEGHDFLYSSRGNFMRQQEPICKLSPNTLDFMKDELSKKITALQKIFDEL